MSAASMDDGSIASLDPVNTGWLDVNGLAVGESFWWWSYEFDHEWDDGYNCQQASETRTDSVPADVADQTLHFEHASYSSAGADFTNQITNDDATLNLAQAANTAAICSGTSFTINIQFTFHAGGELYGHD